MVIVLMGYMGSGKSTVGKELATILNYSFLDLDDYISDKEKVSISNIFKIKGEIYFRRKEISYLLEVLNNSKDVVLALGGGTPCYGNNMNTLLQHKNVKTIYLKLSLPLLAERLFKEKESRPLISFIENKEALLEFIGKHLFERNYHYNRAHYTITTDNKSLKDTVEDILTTLI